MGPSEAPWQPRFGSYRGWLAGLLREENTCGVLHAVCSEDALDLSIYYVDRSLESSFGGIFGLHMKYEGCFNSRPRFVRLLVQRHGPDGWMPPTPWFIHHVHLFMLIVAVCFNTPVNCLLLVAGRC